LQTVFVQRSSLNTVPFFPLVEHYTQLPLVVDVTPRECCLAHNLPEPGLIPQMKTSAFSPLSRYSFLLFPVRGPTLFLYSVRPPDQPLSQVFFPPPQRGLDNVGSYPHTSCLVGDLGSVISFRSPFLIPVLESPHNLCIGKKLNRPPTDEFPLEKVPLM